MQLRIGIYLFAVVVLFAAAGVAPAVAQPIEINNLYSDSTTLCINEYYGFGQPVNYAEAYKCFAANKIYEYLIIMQLNGQGVPANIAKAKALMAEWKKLLGGPPVSLEFENMQQMIAARSETGKPPKRPVDFCTDVAETDYSMNFCFELKDRFDEQKYQRKMQLIRKKLNPEESRLLDKIETAFSAYVQAEGDRGGQEYAGGSAQGGAASLQMKYVRNNFTHLMWQWFIEMKPQPASKRELAKVEAGMKAANEAALGLYKENYPANGNSQDEFDETMQEYESEYEDDTKTSQERWAVLAKLCAELAQDVYKSRDPSVNWSVSMKTALAKLRADEILYSPLGG